MNYLNEVEVLQATRHQSIIYYASFDWMLKEKKQKKKHLLESHKPAYPKAHTHLIRHTRKLLRVDSNDTRVIYTADEFVKKKRAIEVTY